MKRHWRIFMRLLATSGALATLSMAACDFDKALAVQPANLIPAITLEAPENAPLLVAGAAADFDCAFNTFVVVGALIGEEFEDAVQTADRWPYDQRSITSASRFYGANSCTTLGLYTPLQASRVSANNVRHLLE